MNTTATTASQNTVGNAARATRAATAAALFAVAVAVGAAALLAAHGGVETQAAKSEVVKLERVVVVGKRVAGADADANTAIAMAQLPRVVITGRSAAASPESGQRGSLRFAAANVVGAIKAKAL